jgi:hypothetical protein
MTEDSREAEFRATIKALNEACESELLAADKEKDEAVKRAKFLWRQRRATVESNYRKARADAEKKRWEPREGEVVTTATVGGGADGPL